MYNTALRKIEKENVYALKLGMYYSIIEVYIPHCIHSLLLNILISKLFFNETTFIA